MIGSKPDRVFVTWGGTPRGQHALALAIKKTVRRRLGVELSPHKFRHLAAKIYLDQNPGGFEVVRQLLGHKNVRLPSASMPASIPSGRAGRTPSSSCRSGSRNWLQPAAEKASAKSASNATGDRGGRPICVTCRCALGTRVAETIPHGLASVLGFSRNRRAGG